MQRTCQVNLCCNDIQKTYHYQDARDVNCKDNFLPTPRRILNSHTKGKDMEASKNAKEEREGCKLECQSDYKNLDPNPLHLSLPVIRTCDTRAAPLNEKGDYVAEYKYWGKATAWNSKDAVMGWGKNGEDQPADEKVISSSNKDRSEDRVSERQDKRRLPCSLEVRGDSTVTNQLTISDWF